MSDKFDETGSIPLPTAPADEAERLRAERFASLISTVIVGERLPPAMDPDDRMLVDVAAMIRASTGEVALSPDRARDLTSEALQRAGASSRPASISSLQAVAAEPASPDTEADELGARRRSRLKRVLPWTVTALSAAAVLALWLARPTPKHLGRTTEAPSLPLGQRSRPADPLVGIIARADSHRASARIDAIYADRLDGYRTLNLSAKLPRGGSRE